jgi:L-threonylcarbamoyladenylate synthase
MTPPLTAQDAMRLEECLAGHGVAVIPTDTVYGLACNPDSESALRRIYELKRRPPLKPAAVMFFALAPALETLTELGPRTREAVEALLPGPVTLLLPNRLGRFAHACDPAGVAVGGDTRVEGATLPRVCAHTRGSARTRGGSDASLLGLRVPAFTGELAALASVRVPAAQSSANLTGGPNPRRLSDVPLQLREGADLLLNAGELPGAASIVIDLSEYEQTGTWRIVREGPLDSAALARTLG